MIRPPPSPPDAASVLRVLDAIERHPAGTPAGTAFRSALRRMGLEADAAGGLAAVNVLMELAVQAEPDRADQRQAILRAAWAELIPGEAAVVGSPRPRDHRRPVMSVIDFPGRQRPPPAGDVWDPRTRALDQQYILEVLKRRLPPEALRHVAGLDLASIASAVLLEVDTVRHERRFNPRYDEERAGGELGALDRLVGDLPPQPEPPDCA